MNELLSLLCFPQSWDNGILRFNIVLIPRNLNPLKPLAGGPAFVDANIVFNAKLIAGLDGLPDSTTAAIGKTANILNPPTDIRAAWEALQQQFEQADGIVVDDGETAAKRAPAPGSMKPIRKYLPLSYRNAFNFVKARSRYALTGDEYQCAIKNKPAEVDASTDRKKIAWGKLVAYSLRNPLLARKLGLIYEASIDLRDMPAALDNGGWLYIALDNAGDFSTTLTRTYAARIPNLKNITSRKLFAVNQFRVYPAPDNSNSAAYDEIIRESIIYDDGFAKIVHASQPVNQDLSIEDDNSNPPTHDVGIRLGWEDEQITIWYNRQLSQKEEFSNLPVDAPMGVFGYRVDAREKGSADWLSQNMVVNTAPVVLANGGIEIMAAGTPLEPGTEVTPAAHGDIANEGMWAPMYYTSWIGKSLGTSDKDAAEIYQLNNESVVDRNNGTATGKIIPKKTFRLYEQDADHELPLRYGKSYEFRVRLMDISGGGPAFNDDPTRGGENPVEDVSFKRYIAAGALQFEEMDNFYRLQASPVAGAPFPDISVLEHILKGSSTLHVKRPLLSYPAVVFTGKYDKPVELMKARINELNADNDPRPFEVGLPDPDVDAFMVTVEARSLQMDNALSENGKESYIVLYKKKFTIPATAAFDNSFPLSIRYVDFDDVDLGNTLPGLAELSDDEIVLPTARHLRISFTPVVSAAGIDHPLYEVYADKNIELGKTVMFTSFKASAAEENLLSLEPD
ncbi:MAG: hypothetical protein EOO14_01250, partial [Chitinophagaceae bacterium]